MNLPPAKPPDGHPAALSPDPPTTNPPTPPSKFQISNFKSQIPIPLTPKAAGARSRGPSKANSR
jgi:hypothetical protein